MPRCFLARLVRVVVVGMVGALMSGLPPAVAAEDGRIEPNSVTADGNAVDHGPSEGMRLYRGLVGIAAHPSGDGYWLVASDGGIFSFGRAGFHGSMGGHHLNQPVVGIAAHPSGDGYWLVASDGGIFSFGRAGFHGSMGGHHLNQPVVGMAAHPSGDGYWLVASDGGIFSFGAAGFHGSMGGHHLNQPVVGIAAHPGGDGYWLVASDGGVFTFGNAGFHGSTAGQELPAPIVDMAAASSGNGYWLAGRNGQVYAQGVTDHGSAAETEQSVRPPVVGIAARGDDGYWLSHGERLEADYEDTGPHVRRIQQRLTSLGYWLGAVDGVYGELTRQAVYAFQKIEGLPVTGDVDRTTARRMDTASRPQPRSPAGDLVEVDKTRQVVFVVRDGRVLWAWNTSTGTEDPYTYEGRTYMADTPNGRWHFFRQVDGYRESNLGRLYRPKYFHEDGIALHGYSFVPPYPASHGCVRLTESAMDFVWAEDLVPMGSEVWVYGTSPGE